VNEIVPGKQRSFDEVKKEITDRLADERAGQEISALREKIENDRSAGKPLKEIAEGLQLPFFDVPEIDRSGKTADGKPAVDHPEAAKIAEAAFAGTVGIEGEATELGDGGYGWVDVLAIAPQKQKSFDEVKAEVKTAVMEADRRKEITSLASKLVERLGKGETAEALAAELGAKLEKTPAVTRNTSPPGLSQNAVQQAFALPKGGATSTPAPGGKARTILRVVDVIPAPTPTPEQTARLKDELARQMQSDILGEYVSALEARFGLSVNDEALKQALGGGAGREQPDYE